MRLDYCILWFEDQPEEVISSRRRIERHIRNQGFVPKIIQKNNGVEIDELATEHGKLRDVDLVIVDYDLGNDQESGDSIAKKISNKFPVEIIFYSGSAPAVLRQKVCDNNIDGVFVSYRDELATDINRIIDYSLRKFTDLNNFRGVVAGTVAEFDHLMNQVVSRHHHGIDDETKGKLIAKIKKRIVKSAKDNLRQCENLTEKDNVQLAELMKHRAFTSDLRRRTAGGVLEDNDLSEKEVEIFGEIAKVLGLRNTLSHVRSITDSKGTRLEYESSVFTDKEFTSVRKELQKHLANLNSIVKKIDTGDGN